MTEIIIAIFQNIYSACSNGQISKMFNPWFTGLNPEYFYIKRPVKEKL